MALLEIENLEKGFLAPEGVREVVIDIPSFAMEAGEEVALEGGSGTGKTTLLHLIAGILTPDRGVVRLDGCDLATLSEGQRDRLRSKALGYIFQSFHLLQGLSALENVILAMSFGRGVDRARAEDLLKTLGLEERLHHRPSQLSIGQQQRVAVARALANRPQLVLADEPTGNLDARRSQEALEMIRTACHKQGAALLLVSHDQAILEKFERRVRLEDLNRASEVVS